MKVRPLRNVADYDEALVAIADCFAQEPDRGSPEADAFDRLALVIAEDESRRWSVEPLDSTDASN